MFSAILAKKKYCPKLRDSCFFHISVVNGLRSQTKLNSTSGKNFTWGTLQLQTPQSITVKRNPQGSENQQLSLSSTD